MATGWMKSLQCKSKALDDVVHNNNHRRRHHHRHSPSNSSSSCKNSVQSLKDVVETSTTKTKSKKQKAPPTEPSLVVQSTIKTRFSRIPSLAELPEGHPSRNVVEIIFHSRWGERDFSGRVEMVFKVQNLTRTVNRFEEYREAVKARARGGGGGEDHARCVADGNEVMRFYCLGATTGTDETSGGAWGLYNGGKGAMCMYSWSGEANDSVGGGRGRRAMMVCRVIAGRVCEELGYDSFIEGYDSVSRKNGELTILDRRALLPCFLIIYNKF